MTKEPDLEEFGSEMLLITTCFPNSQLCGPSEQLGAKTEPEAFRLQGSGLGAWPWDQQ